MYFLATMIVLGMGVSNFLCRTPGLLPRYVELFAVLCADLHVPVPDFVAPEHVVDRFSGPVMTLIQFNPMYSMLGGYTELLQNDAFPADLYADIVGGLGTRGRGHRIPVFHFEGA
jgi:teichoic acid transport system permease protein